MQGKINFLEKGVFVLTYKKLLIAVILWAAFCFSVFIVESGYSWWLGKSVSKYKLVLRTLNLRKERTMALVEATKVKQTGPDAAELSEVYSHFPVWSTVMADVAKSMPPQMWLTSISSEYLSENSTLRKIELGGMSRNAAFIANFVKQLNDQAPFRNMVLSRSNRIEGGENQSQNPGYSFVVLGEVLFGEKKWD